MVVQARVERGYLAGILCAVLELGVNPTALVARRREGQRWSRQPHRCS